MVLIEPGWAGKLSGFTLPFAADAEAHKVVFVTQGRDANTIGGFAQFLGEHKGEAEQIACVSIDMSKAFIKGVTPTAIFLDSPQGIPFGPVM